MSEIEKQIVDHAIEQVQRRMARRDQEERGVLVAEGDSWFDLLRSDVLDELEDLGYEVESIAAAGDTVEEMAYSNDQLEALTRRLNRLARRGTVPRAILLSGGGNDFTGQTLKVLLNHSESGLAPLSQDVVTGLIDVRLRAAYTRLINLITETCCRLFPESEQIPVLVHGYAHAVPDGRGFLFFGPWLEPAFKSRGYTDRLAENTKTIECLVDQFNNMLISLTKRFPHVRYVDVRPCLTNGVDYKDKWKDELHPRESAFTCIAKKFAEIIENG